MRLELKNVCKSYGNKEIIKDMNIVFEAGIYGLLGPNGAGKSTTIRMISTVEMPVSGSILYDGANIYEMGEKFRGKLGYIPQKSGYYPDFTAEKFLYYVAELKEILNKSQVVCDCLKKVGLFEEKDKKLRKFSGGMKQRINIAQALLNDPEILILDEPTVGLDPNERLNLKNLLSELSENKIIILATHIVSDIEDIADRVLILQKGKIKIDKTMKDILEKDVHKIWHCVLEDKDQINYIKKHYKISKMQRQGKKTILRIISDSKPCDDATAVDENLEEIYLRITDNLR